MLSRVVVVIHNIRRFRGVGGIKNHEQSTTVISMWIRLIMQVDRANAMREVMA